MPACSDAGIFSPAAEKEYCSIFVQNDEIVQQYDENIAR